MHCFWFMLFVHSQMHTMLTVVQTVALESSQTFQTKAIFFCVSDIFSRAKKYVKQSLLTTPPEPVYQSLTETDNLMKWGENTPSKDKVIKHVLKPGYYSFLMNF